MTTIDEYMELYRSKDRTLMDKVGMDKSQKESINSETNSRQKENDE